MRSSSHIHPCYVALWCVSMQSSQGQLLEIPGLPCPQKPEKCCHHCFLCCREMNWKLLFILHPTAVGQPRSQLVRCYFNHLVLSLFIYFATENTWAWNMVPGNINFKGLPFENTQTHWNNHTHLHHLLITFYECTAPFSDSFFALSFIVFLFFFLTSPHQYNQSWDVLFSVR